VQVLVVQEVQQEHLETLLLVLVQQEEPEVRVVPEVLNTSEVLWETTQESLPT
jgi:hypothetical protein